MNILLFGATGMVGDGVLGWLHRPGACRRVNRALFEHYRETIQRRPQKSPCFALTNAHFKNSIYFIVNRQPTSQAGRRGFESRLPLHFQQLASLATSAFVSFVSINRLGRLLSLAILTKAPIPQPGSGLERFPRSSPSELLGRAPADPQ